MEEVQDQSGSGGKEGLEILDLPILQELLRLAAMLSLVRIKHSASDAPAQLESIKAYLYKKKK